MRFLYLHINHSDDLYIHIQHLFIFDVYIINSLCTSIRLPHFRMNSQSKVYWFIGFDFGLSFQNFHLKCPLSLHFACISFILSLWVPHIRLLIPLYNAHLSSNVSFLLSTQGKFIGFLVHRLRVFPLFKKCVS